MEKDFLRTRLESLTKNELMDIIMDVNNATIFASLFRKDLEPQPKEALVQLILKTEGAFIDNNINQDQTHVREAQIFDQLVAFRRQDPNFKPDMWKPKPHQEAHIARVTKGLLSPMNSSRSVWDGSKTGRGKTPSSTLAAIGIKVRYILVVCPDAVIKKWHDALSPLGLFDYKLCTYAGLINTKGRGDTKWGRYKPDVNKQSNIEDMEWLQIRSTGLTGINDHIYDWSFLPGTDPATGLGGCLVIWDEVQNAKNTSGAKIGVCFKQFVDYLHSEPRKFIRALYLSGTIQEKTEDLPYILKALDYIPQATAGEQTAFVKRTIAPRFRELMGDDWQPGFQVINDPKIMLILFIRVVAKRQFKFSEIPDPLVFAAYAMKLIPIDQMEDLIKFYDTTLVPNFRELLAEDWREDMEPLDSTHKFIEFLKHAAKNPKFSYVNIAAIIDGFFENPITFQGIQLADDQIARFMQINSDIEALLMEVVRGNKKFDGGLLGQIQKTISELEVLKLAPFTELARKALFTPLPNGAQGSVVISVLRNSSARHMAWRLEAIMLVDAFLNMLRVQQPKYQAVNQMDAFAQLVYNQEAAFRDQMITAILNHHDIYRQKEKIALANGTWLQIKRGFVQYSKAQMMEMPLEDLANEYIKWDYYLDVNKFNYVCIYVGNFGVPSKEDEDLESPDEMDRIREGKTLTPDQKNFAKEAFQENERRIFVTNMKIAREGIDLHDTSLGGMHPRTGIISPGDTARYLVQMLGRFVREGQTSESLRIVGFIDNIRGVKSWEAKFMERLSMKVKDLMLLQTGEMSLDIMNNIENDGKSIWKQIMEEMAHGGITITPDATPPVSGDTSAISIHKPGLAPVQGGGALGNLIQKTFGVRKEKTVQIGPRDGIGGNPDDDKFLPMKVNETHLLFDLSKKSNGDVIGSNITRALLVMNLSRVYWEWIEPINNKGLPPGVIVFRPGFIVQGISQTETLAKIEEFTGLRAKREDVPDRSLDNYGLKPSVKVDKLMLIFESTTSFLLGPQYPIQSKIPPELFGVGALEIIPQGKGIIRLKGTTDRLMLAYYAIRAIVYFEAPSIFGTLEIQDPAGVIPKIESKYLITSGIKGGKYRLVSGKDLIRLFPLALGSINSLIAPLQARLVVDEYIVYTPEYSGITVLQPYWDLVTKVIGNAPQNLDNPQLAVNTQNPN